MIVIDSSALVSFLAGIPPRASLNERIWAESELHAPHVIDLEFIQAIRGLSRGGAMDPEEAGALVRDLDDLRILRYPHHRFAQRIWALRSNLTAYDAAFVALAEALQVPLVTIDARLARAGQHLAEIEVYA